MSLRQVLIILLAIFFISCQKKPIEATKAKAPEIVDEEKMIDVAAVVEESGGKKIAEFSGGGWAIAVRNLKSGYTYYYDSNNNFLGRSKE